MVYTAQSWPWRLASHIFFRYSTPRRCADGEKRELLDGYENDKGDNTMTRDKFKLVSCAVLEGSIYTFAATAFALMLSSEQRNLPKATQITDLRNRQWDCIHFKPRYIMSNSIETLSWHWNASDAG
jgi:hypothetical protein